SALRSAGSVSLLRNSCHSGPMPGLMRKNVRVMSCRWAGACVAGAAGLACDIAAAFVCAKANGVSETAGSNVLGAAWGFGIERCFFIATFSLRVAACAAVKGLPGKAVKLADRFDEKSRRGRLC